MKAAEYERRLLQQLCWICGAPTTRSSAQQRQCPNCRRKWSFRRRQLRWNLLQLFASGLTPAEAARRLQICYRTAWTHFLDFERVVRREGSRAHVSCLHHFLQIQKGQLPWKEISPDQDLISIIYSREFCRQQNSCSGRAKKVAATTGSTGRPRAPAYHSLLRGRKRALLAKESSATRAPCNCVCEVPCDTRHTLPGPQNRFGMNAMWHTTVTRDSFRITTSLTSKSGRSSALPAVPIAAALSKGRCLLATPI